MLDWLFGSKKEEKKV